MKYFTQTFGRQMNKADVVKRKNSVYKLYLKLLKKHGPAREFWPEWCAKKKSLALREIIALGAILTQRISWRNADMALKRLKEKDLLSLEKIASLNNLDELTKLIKPAGFYQTKPKRLFNFCQFIVKDYGSLAEFAQEDLELAREKLLALNGIGPETADTILLYALDRPTFVIDEYTKRWIEKLGLTEKKSYGDLKEFFEGHLPKEVEIFQNFHTLIIIEQKGKEWSTMKRINNYEK